MTAPAVMAATFGITRACEDSAQWHADRAAEIQRAMGSDGLADPDRAFLAAQWEFHDTRAAGYRKAMEAPR